MLRIGVAQISDDQAERIPNAVAASSKLTPCLRAFLVAFCGSHSNVNAMSNSRRPTVFVVCA